MGGLAFIGCMCVQIVLGDQQGLDPEKPEVQTDLPHVPDEPLILAHPLLQYRCDIRPQLQSAAICSMVQSKLTLLPHHGQFGQGMSIKMNL